MKETIMNHDIYKTGELQYMERLTKEENPDIEDLIWKALYNDNFQIDIPEAYYLITENIGITEGNNYLTECINADLVAVA